MELSKQLTNRPSCLRGNRVISCTRIRIHGKFLEFLNREYFFQMQSHVTQPSTVFASLSIYCNCSLLLLLTQFPNESAECCCFRTTINCKEVFTLEYLLHTEQNENRFISFMRITSTHQFGSTEYFVERLIKS